MGHIERMEVELKELVEKRDKLVVFLEKETEQPKFTDEIQRRFLALQNEHMESYIKILKARIEYDKIKAKKEEKPCYAGDNYDEIEESCITATVKRG